MKRSFLYILICMFLLSVTACVDDEIRPFDDIPEGETTVGVIVEFNPLTPALATRASAGDAIKNIESLCVLVYGLDGNLTSRHLIKGSDGSQIPGYVEKDTERQDNGQIAESETPCAKFNLTIPYGLYRIYAVANMGDLNGYDVQTVDKLKSIVLQWQEDDTKKNNQMLGHFTEKGVFCNDDKDYVLKINRKHMEVRAGIRRVASKVTLAFDGSQLKEGICIHQISSNQRYSPNLLFREFQYTVAGG